MAFAIPKQPYSGKIGVTTVGTGEAAVKLGGEDAYPFHLFEGSMPNPPRVAMEVWDFDPSKDWPAAAVAPFKDVISSPEAWAKKCVEKYGADLIVVQLKSIDPNGMNRGADDAVKVVQKVLDAVKVPVVLWGTANNQKDEEVLKKIAESCQGKNLSLAPVEEGNHKGVGAGALAYAHTIVASSPIDVNLAKQLNILLGNLGVSSQKLLIDPTTGGLGYGLEYSYSVIERIRMAALTQEDDKLQIPIISNVANEIWKCKEAGQKIEDAPTLGDPEKRAILMETVGAVCYLLAGADVVVLRHPESVRLVRSYIDLMMKGGSAIDLAGISKALKPEGVDLAAMAPAPNLDFGEPAKKEAAKKEAPKKEAPKPAAPKPAAPKPAEPKKEEKAPVAEAAAAKPPEKVVDLKAKKDEAEARAKAEAEAAAKAEAKAKAVAEAEAQAKAEEGGESQGGRRRQGASRWPRSAKRRN